MSTRRTRGSIVLAVAVGLGVLSGLPATAATDDQARPTGVPSEFCQWFPVFCGD